MALLDVSEFSKLARDATGTPTTAGLYPQVAQQQVAIGGGSLQSSAFDLNTRFIRVHADAICRVAIGSNPTAAGTSMRMAAGQTEYFGVLPGHKIAVITST